MKKIFAVILLLVTLVLSVVMLSSCSPKNDDNAKIQIWYYNYDNSDWYYENAMSMVLSNLEAYCNSNNIPYEIIKYDTKTMSYVNYVLKRNVAMANGNAIILEDSKGFVDIAKEHADYSKIPRYADLMDAYKGRYCIPLGVGYRIISVNNKVMEYYGIAAERNIMSYYEYLKTVQQMKEKGAKFKINAQTLDDTVQYHMTKNNLRFFNENSDIVKDKEEFKTAIKKTFTDVCDDLKLYYKDLKSKKDIELLLDEKRPQDYRVYDESINLIFLEDNLKSYESFYIPTSWSEIYQFKNDIVDKRFIIYRDMNFSPCVYIHKNVTNNKIYDVVNSILKDDVLASICRGSYNLYSPVIDCERIRKDLNVDENWEHNGLIKSTFNRYDNENYRKMYSTDYEKHKTMLKTINDSFNMIIVDKEKTKNLADSYFNNESHYYKINRMIKRLILKGNLVENDYNYNEKEIYDLINKELDDFIINFYVHYK